MFGIKVQEKNETSIFCPILLCYKSCFFLIRQQIYMGKNLFLFFALHFQHFLPYQCPAEWFIVPTSWQPLPSTFHLTSTHSIPVPALFRAPVVIQKGGFVTRLLTMRQVTLMLHSKMYDQPLGLAQSSDRSCSITFLCVSVRPFALRCITGGDTSILPC